MEYQIFDKEGVPTIKVNEPSVLENYTLVDVRNPDEFNGELGHIIGASLITLGQELDNYLEKEAKDRKILFICRSGARSGRATLMARELGFNNVFNLEGGMIGWNERHFPVIHMT